MPVTDGFHIHITFYPKPVAGCRRLPYRLQNLFIKLLGKRLHYFKKPGIFWVIHNGKEGRALSWLNCSKPVR